MITFTFFMGMIAGALLVVVGQDVIKFYSNGKGGK